MGLGQNSGKWLRLATAATALLLCIASFAALIPIERDFQYYPIRRWNFVTVILSHLDNLSHTLRTWLLTGWVCGFLALLLSLRVFRLRPPERWVRVSARVAFAASVLPVGIYLIWLLPNLPCTGRW